MNNIKNELSIFKSEMNSKMTLKDYLKYGILIFAIVGGWHMGIWFGQLLCVIEKGLKI